MNVTAFQPTLIRRQCPLEELFINPVIAKEPWSFGKGERWI
ncbi:hypothetical protein ACPOL_6574 [Acidisarcina polymorpha]|uniref:Uncharacterized protein n=1 Tax=Acidisarcina polymorpha TaxID=2211140 RepID=A0A2Z5G933_9BACT|nr:hypothetical protein ACPOL_6574 [Acidisarcina polymorpha]